MPTSADETPGLWPTGVTVPLAGEPRTAWSVRDGLQDLANRTRTDHDTLAAGVKRVQFHTSLDALRAVTGMANGDMAIAVDALGRRARYTYDTSYSGADEAPYLIKPAGVADAAPGRWLHEFVYFGISNADETANKWPWRGPNAIVLQEGTTGLDVELGASASWQTVRSVTGLPLRINDVVHLQYIGSASTTNLTGSLDLRLVTVSPSGVVTPVTEQSGTLFDFFAVGKSQLVGVQGRGTLGGSGTYAYRLEAMVPSGSIVTFLAPLLQVTVVRP